MNSNIIFSKKIIIILFLIFIILVFTIFLMPVNKSQRVVFIADTHASNDSKDRSLAWATHSFERIKSIFNSRKVAPSHFLWLGDMIDFSPLEWETVKTWVDWINHNYPTTQQYALMGNHDYLYYTYPEITSTFNSQLTYEVESYLKKDAKQGDNVIYIDNVNKFILNRNVLLIDENDKEQVSFEVADIKKIDFKNNSILLEKNLEKPFIKNKTLVRQGFTEKRGIESFLSTFKETKTKNTKNVFFIGNVCFILISMDNYFTIDYTNGINKKFTTKGFSDEDLIWLEKTIAIYENTHNIIIGTHIAPDFGKNLNGLHDPQNVNNFNEKTKENLKNIIKKYHITAWISGHTHPDARINIIHTQKFGTNFLLVPSLGMGEEGQILTLDLNNNQDILSFKYWSTDKNEFIKEINIPARFAVSINKIQ